MSLTASTDGSTIPLNPNQSNGYWTNAAASILDFLVRYYPPYYFQNHKYKWLLSIITSLISTVSIVFTISLCFSIFYVDTDTKEGFKSRNVPFHTILFFLHFLFAAMDKLICLYYFACKFDDSSYNNLGNNNQYRSEKSYVTLRLVICMVVWLVFFIFCCCLSFSFPAYMYFGWQIPFIWLLVLFHLSYHLPAIKSQFIMSAEMLSTQCYLNDTSQSLTNINLDNNAMEIQLSEYNVQYQQFQKKCKLFIYRAYCVFAYTITDILLLIVYIVRPIYNISILGYGAYSAAHTIYSIIPFIEFMMAGSRITLKYDNTIKDADELRENVHGVTYEKLNSFVTSKFPMFIYLFGVKVTLKNTIGTILFFVFFKFWLSVIVNWILYDYD